MAYWMLLDIFNQRQYLKATLWVVKKCNHLQTLNIWKKNLFWNKWKSIAEIFFSNFSKKKTKSLCRGWNPKIFFIFWWNSQCKATIPNCVHHLFWPRLMNGKGHSELWGHSQIQLGLMGLQESYSHNLDIVTMHASDHPHIPPPTYYPFHKTPGYKRSIEWCYLVTLWNGWNPWH
jgi:hypothetical protein